jgi:hypothetical protein
MATIQCMSHFTSLDIWISSSVNQRVGLHSCDKKCGPWTSSIGLISKPVRNARCQAPIEQHSIGWILLRLEKPGTGAQMQVWIQITQGTLTRMSLGPSTVYLSRTLWEHKVGLKDFLFIYLFVYLFIYFSGSGLWTQGFTLAKQAFFYLSHTSSPFCSGYFRDRVLLFAQADLDHDLPIFLSLFFFLWYWSLNSELYTCKEGTLPLEPHLQLMIILFYAFQKSLEWQVGTTPSFLRWGLTNIFCPGWNFLI